jgi:chemotaxis protein histidine kinase CheA
MTPQINVKRFSRAKDDTPTPSSPPPPPKVTLPTRRTFNPFLPTIKERASKNDNDNDSEDEESDSDSDSDSDDEDLNELTRSRYVSKSAAEKDMKSRKEQEKEIEKENKKMEKELEKEQKKREKEMKDAEKSVEKAAKLAEKAQKTAENESTRKVKAEDNALFSKKGSELYGRDKLELISKINQYKVLFPDNKKLQALKLKKNSTIEDLQQYLAECDAIIETDSVEAFVTDSILHCLKMVEMVSTRTRYNIRGLSEMLRATPQFNTLTRQLYIKYKVFGSAPPETQLLLLVATSTWVCLEKNKADGANQHILGQRINMSDL